MWADLKFFSPDVMPPCIHMRGGEAPPSDCTLTLNISTTGQSKAWKIGINLSSGSPAVFPYPEQTRTRTLSPLTAESQPDTRHRAGMAGAAEAPQSRAALNFTSAPTHTNYKSCTGENTKSTFTTTLLHPPLTAHTLTMQRFILPPQLLCRCTLWDIKTELWKELQSAALSSAQ